MRGMPIRCHTRWGIAPVECQWFGHVEWMPICGSGRWLHILFPLLLWWRWQFGWHLHSRFYLFFCAQFFCNAFIHCRPFGLKSIKIVRHRCPCWSLCSSWLLALCSLDCCFWFFGNCWQWCTIVVSSRALKRFFFIFYFIFFNLQHCNFLKDRLNARWDTVFKTEFGRFILNYLFFFPNRTKIRCTSRQRPHSKIQFMLGTQRTNNDFFEWPSI